MQIHNKIGLAKQKVITIFIFRRNNNAPKNGNSKFFTTLSQVFIYQIGF